MVRIRLATLADIPEIKACALACFPKANPDRVISDFTVSVRSPLRVVYVADYGGRIVGHVITNMFKSDEGDEEECREGCIAWVGVHPAHRKSGIAAKLMTAAEKAMVHGCEYVYLHVHTSNLAAVNLYTKIQGYEILDTPAEVIEGEEAHLMRKQLPGKQPHLHGHKFSHGVGMSTNRNASTRIKKWFSFFKPKLLFFKPRFYVFHPFCFSTK